jgi:hypothetical protein
MIRIRSKRTGFRRTGVAHSDQWMEHPDETFSPEQLEQLLDEPMLQVEFVQEDGAVAPNDVVREQLWAAKREQEQLQAETENAQGEKRGK